jgi:hypothetical protein
MVVEALGQVALLLQQVVLEVAGQETQVQVEVLLVQQVIHQQLPQAKGAAEVMEMLVQGLLVQELAAVEVVQVLLALTLFPILMVAKAVMELHLQLAVHQLLMPVVVVAAVQPLL